MGLEDAPVSVVEQVADAEAVGGVFDDVFGRARPGFAASASATRNTRCSDRPGLDLAPASHAKVSDGIEWDETTPEMNLVANRSNMVWKIADRTCHVGDRVKIDLDNAAGSDH